MGRRARFTEDELLDAALHLMAEGGPGATTMAAIAKTSGAPVGSIYHRFASRDLLLARLWIRSIRRFQLGVIKALGGTDLDAAALATVQYALDWTREHFDEARVLVLFRREDLAGRWPEELGTELATLNEEIETAMRDYARRRYGHDGADVMQLLTFALADVPYAAWRRYLLAGKPPPPSIDKLVAATCRSVLSINGSSPTAC